MPVIVHVSRDDDEDAANLGLQIATNGYYTPQEVEAIKGVVIALDGYYGLGE